MKRQYIHRDEVPVYTCRTCVNSMPQGGVLYCPVYGVRVMPRERACAYRDVRVAVAGR